MSPFGEARTSRRWLSWIAVISATAFVTWWFGEDLVTIHLLGVGRIRDAAFVGDSQFVFTMVPADGCDRLYEVAMNGNSRLERRLRAQIPVGSIARPTPIRIAVAADYQRVAWTSGNDVKTSASFADTERAVTLDKPQNQSIPMAIYFLDRGRRLCIVWKREPCTIHDVTNGHLIYAELRERDFGSRIGFANEVSGHLLTANGEVLALEKDALHYSELPSAHRCEEDSAAEYFRLNRDISGDGKHVIIGCGRSFTHFAMDLGGRWKMVENVSTTHRMMCVFVDSNGAQSTSVVAVTEHDIQLWRLASDVAATLLFSKPHTLTQVDGCRVDWNVARLLVWGYGHDNARIQAWQINSRDQVADLKCTKQLRISILRVREIALPGGH